MVAALATEGDMVPVSTMHMYYLLQPLNENRKCTYPHRPAKSERRYVPMCSCYQKCLCSTAQRASSDASTKSARAPPETRAAGQGGTSAPSAPHSVIASTSGKAGNNVEMTDDLMEGIGAFLTGTGK